MVGVLLLCQKKVRMAFYIEVVLNSYRAFKRTDMPKHRMSLYFLSLHLGCKEMLSSFSHVGFGQFLLSLYLGILFEKLTS